MVDMALIDSGLGLFGAVNKKVGALTSVAKGIMCLPSILTGLPGILGNVAQGILGSLERQALAMANGLANLVGSIIGDAVSKITGSIKAILQLEATVLALVKGTIATIQGIYDQAKKIYGDGVNQENCRFAAAEMFKCLAGSLIGDLSKKLASKAMSKGGGGISSLVDKATNKLAQPGNVITQYTNKLSRSIDKATNQINTSKLL